MAQLHTNEISVTNQMPLFLANARVARQQAIVACLAIWRESMITMISGKGTGRVYTHKGYTHQASAPGQPPARETGELASSIRWSFDGRYGQVGTPLRKGLWLERGTSKMAPRPFVAASFQANRQLLYSLLTRRWDEGGMSMTRGQIRTYIYAAGRLLGDVSALAGGIDGMSGVRSGLYTSGKMLGDIGAVTGGTMGSRVVARGAGRGIQPLVADAGGGRIGRRAAGRGAGATIRSLID